MMGCGVKTEKGEDDKTDARGQGSDFPIGWNDKSPGDSRGVNPSVSIPRFRLSGLGVETALELRSGGMQSRASALADRHGAGGGWLRKRKLTPG
jgi:hypothetical protein